MSSNEQTRPISEWYVEWANTLDSAGKDSRAVRERITPEMVVGIFSALHGTIRRSRMTDRIKKHLFYGKDYDIENDYKAPDRGMNHESKVQDKFNHDTIRLLHGILGKIDEVGELTQALFEYLFYDVPIDPTNIREEVGDSQWYDALIARWLGDSSFDGIQQANYRKLTTRYPAKQWSQGHSLERNLDAEKQALEGSNKLYLMRTFANFEDDQKIWLMFDRNTTLRGTKSDTKLSIMYKWRKVHNIEDSVSLKVTTFTGVLSPSEAAATIADIKQGKNNA